LGNQARGGAAFATCQPGDRDSRWRVRTISLTSENGQLVIRDETCGAGHVIAVIGVAE